MDQDLQAFVKGEAEASGVPGVAMGVYAGGREQYAFCGVTSIENPLPVDRGTLFQFGSTGKTFTATAMMRLVEQGRVDLSERVRVYVPELRLKDEEVAREVRVSHLLNHTAGWQGDFFADTGEGDDALARFVGLLAGVEQEFPLGERMSYNDCALSLAGRVIEKVTGQTYERAVGELLLGPLGLADTLMFPRDVMTRRFAVGHHVGADASVRVARPWMFPRCATPGGGLSATAADQIAWARFHMGDGRAPDGKRLLSADLLRLMQQPTVRTPGGLGDAVGISWMLQDVGGVRVVKHGGATNGQHSAFRFLPERDFAVAVLTNCAPNGWHLHERLVAWAMRTFLGVVQPEPQPVIMPVELLWAYAGIYEGIAQILRVTAEQDALRVQIEVKPHAYAAITDDPGKLGAPAPMRLGMLADPADAFVVLDGDYLGERGSFSRTASGEVDGIQLRGRFFQHALPASVAT